MIFDKDLMFLDNVAYDATPAVVELGSVDPLRGEPVKIAFRCAGGDIAGATGINILSDDNATPTTVVATFPFTAAQLNGGVSFNVTPDQGIDVNMTIALTGTVTAGTGITAGIVLDAQTAR